MTDKERRDKRLYQRKHAEHINALRRARYSEDEEYADKYKTAAKVRYHKIKQDPEAYRKYLDRLNAKRRQATEERRRLKEMKDNMIL